jgi:exonuclease SbcC
MKIKRVEIQAFKSYLNNKDGTFDFTVKGGQPADIISIYAPNGFGKTSFYDAVDYCMTNNITRFIRDSSLANINNTDAKELNQNGQKQHILRAKNAPENLESIVKIITDTNNFERKVSTARNGSKDYAFDDKKTKPEELYFRSVMLSQEAIDGFLRELKPEARYERFMAQQLGGDDTLEKNRQLIQSMLGGLNNRLEELQSKVDTITNKNLLIELGGEPTIDSNCLIAINELTTELNEQGCNFIAFNDDFDDDYNAKLILQIAQLEGKSNQEIEVIQNEKSQRERLVDNFHLYEKSHREIDENHKYIVKLTKQKGDIELIIELNKKQSLLTEQINTRRKILEHIKSNKKHFPNFVKQMQTKYEYKEKLSDLHFNLNKNEQTLKNSHAVHIELQSQNITLLKAYEKLEALKNEASKYFSEITRIEIDNHELNSIEPTVKIIELDKIISNLKFEGIEVQSFKVDELDVITMSKFNNEIFSKLAKEYSEAVIKLNKSTKQLDELNRLLDAAKQQKSSITTLIKLGSQLINHNQDQYCPLCQHEHESFAYLADAINSNSSLSDSQQRFLKELEVCQTQLKIESDNINRLNEDFSTQKKIHLDFLREQLYNLIQEKKSISYTLEEIDKNTAEVNRLKELTEQKSPDIFESYIDGKITKNKEDRAALEILINKIIEECQKLAEDAQHLKVAFAMSTSESANCDKTLADYLVFLAELKVPENIIEPNFNELALKEIIANQLNVAANLFEEKQQEIKDNEEALSTLEAQYTISFFENPIEKINYFTKHIAEYSDQLVILNKITREFYFLIKELGQEQLLKDDDWTTLKQMVVNTIFTLKSLIKEKDLLTSRLRL